MHPRFILGGGTEYLVNTVEGLHKNGIENHIVTTSIDRDSCSELISRTLKSASLDVMDFSKLGFFWTAGFRSMIRADKKCQSLHFHGIYTMRIGVLFRVFGWKVVYQPHGYWRSKKERASLLDLVIDLVAVFAAHKVIITSPDELSNLPRFVHRVATKKSVLVLTRINQDADSNIIYDPCSNILICIAIRGVYQKGIDNLLKLMMKAKDNGLDVKLVHYYGSRTEEYDDLCRQISALKLENWYELRRAVPAIWSERIGVVGFVSFSRFEGRSLAIQEAMHQELPVFLTRCEGHVDLLDDKSASFVPVEDLDAQYDGLVAFLDNPLDRVRKVEVAKKKISCEPTADDMAREIYQVHAEI